MRGKLSDACGLLTALVFIACTSTPAQAQKGLVLDQHLDGNGRGYTVIRVWGTDYEMGYAQAQLLGDAIVQGNSEMKSFLGVTYNYVRGLVAGSLWMPPGIEDEFDGMLASLAITHPTAQIDKLDLKLASTMGEWLYACRSHTCWGRYVEPPVRTLSTRRLDFGSFIPLMNHHVLVAHAPDDGSPSWVNVTWPGVISACTGVNEFGTLVSLHDYICATDFAAGRMPRMVACRYALTYATDPDVSTHLADTYAELQTYEMMTGTFLNFYAPESHGGVMVCHPPRSGPDFYYLRTPQVAWHHGEAMITTNAWTDGTYTPSDEDFGADAYYDNETPKSLESHWNLLAGSGSNLHLLSIAYRDRGDITIWADGRIDGVGRTPRMEWEWDELLGIGDMNCDGTTSFGDINAFVYALVDEPRYHTLHPDCRILNADCNHDGAVTFGDINAFVDLLVGK